MARRALITGITGQDGPILAAHLLSLGYDVAGMMRGQNNPRRPQIEARLPGVHLIEADLLDAGSLLRMLDAAEPDEIYHLAAHRRGGAAAGSTAGGPATAGAVTALGTERLLESVRIASGRSASRGRAGFGFGFGLGPRIFCAASHEIYGPAPRIVDEASAEAPETAHGIASAYAHATAARYRQAFGMAITRGVLFEHVSTGVDAMASDAVPEGGVAEARAAVRAVLGVARGARREAPVAIAAACDIGSAEDYVRAMHLALQHETADDFIIASGEQHTLGAIAIKAWRIAGVRGGRIVDTGAARSGPIASTKKARIMLGWQPERGIDDVVATLVAAECERLELRPAPRRRVSWAAARDERMTIGRDHERTATRAA